MHEIEEDWHFAEQYSEIDRTYRLWRRVNASTMAEGGHHAHSSLTPHLVYLIDHRLSTLSDGARTCASATSGAPHHTGATSPTVAGTDRL